MLQREMQHLRQIAKYCAAEQSAAREVQVASVRARLRQAGYAAVAEELGVLGLICFLVELWAGRTNGVLQHPLT